MIGKELAKKSTTKGVRDAVKALAAELKVAMAHRKGVRKAGIYHGQVGLRLHLGCGPNIKPGWVNCGLFEYDADLGFDLRERWPFGDASAVEVYSEHVFEHLEYPYESGHYLSESIRVLAPGGKITIAVPDTGNALGSYGNPSAEYWPQAKRLWHRNSEDWTQIEHINYHFRQDKEHRFAYDEETLVRHMEKHGFLDAHRREFEPGLDTEDRRLGTLTVVAIRP